MENLYDKKYNHLFPIILRDYDEKWISIFQTEKDLLESQLKRFTSAKIIHFGSTSIPGMKSKPIIDILIQIPRAANIEKISEIMRDHGFLAVEKSYYPKPGIIFMKGYEKDGFRGQVFHAHLRYEDETCEETFFRDYLLADAEVKRQYIDLKEKLAKRFMNDKTSYTQGKTVFVSKVTQHAKRYFAHKGEEIISMNRYKKILNPVRQRQTTVLERSNLEEFYSDKSRILFASSFRRLQQKAQVFSLESNCNIRTRLTHSLEVADVGRGLAFAICKKLQDRNLIDENDVFSFVAVIENACLIHDLGNPPFGHFGEQAIKSWVTTHLRGYAHEAGIGDASFDTLLGDFINFDGNPQGLRTVCRLHCETDKFGLNLTYPTLLSSMKYPECVSTPNKVWKKYGVFDSERTIVETMYRRLELEPNKKIFISLYCGGF